MKKLFIIIAAAVFSFPAFAEDALPEGVALVVSAKSEQAEVQAAVRAYHAAVAAAINQYRTYPDRARRREIEGKVTVRFMLNRGTPEISVIEDLTNAHGILQGAALKTMEQAVAAVDVPELLKDEEVSIRYPFVFKLEG